MQCTLVSKTVAVLIIARTFSSICLELNKIYYLDKHPRFGMQSRSHIRNFNYSENAYLVRNTGVRCILIELYF